tara:strand:+ start:74 stop:256 length:183 start_codon:yes stop_codon:yes gene_type:complete
MDDRGFFGPNRLFYWWMMNRYKHNQKIDGKIGYWLYVKEMKEWQKRAETRRREAANRPAT